MSARTGRQGGFTLVELLVAIALSALVALVLAQTFLVGYGVLTAESRALAGDTAISTATLSLTRDLSSGTVSSALPDSLTAGSGTLSLSYGNPAVTVSYSIDAAGNLIRSVAGVSSVSSRGLQQLLVTAGTPACFLSVTLTPSAVGATPQTVQIGQRPQGCF
jgi:prepilin-type N-terminal cleavage/methylation domain-containing protein